MYYNFYCFIYIIRLIIKNGLGQIILYFWICETVSNERFNLLEKEKKETFLRDLSISPWLNRYDFWSLTTNIAFWNSRSLICIARSAIRFQRNVCPRSDRPTTPEMLIEHDLESILEARRAPNTNTKLKRYANAIENEKLHQMLLVGMSSRWPSLASSHQTAINDRFAGASSKKSYFLSFRYCFH